MKKQIELPEHDYIIHRNWKKTKSYKNQGYDESKVDYYFVDHKKAALSLPMFRDLLASASHLESLDPFAKKSVNTLVQFDTENFETLKYKNKNVIKALLLITSMIGKDPTEKIISVDNIFHRNLSSLCFYNLYVYDPVRFIIRRKENESRGIQSESAINNKSIGYTFANLQKQENNKTLINKGMMEQVEDSQVEYTIGIPNILNFNGKYREIYYNYYAYVIKESFENGKSNPKILYSSFDKNSEEKIDKIIIPENLNLISENNNPEKKNDYNYHLNNYLNAQKLVERILKAE